MTTLPIRFTRPTAEMPTRAHPTDAGLDLRAADRAVVSTGKTALVGTGIAVAIPEGHAGYIHPRSGLAKHHQVGILNAPGLIDPDYRGELKVLLINHGGEPFIVARGDRIAQLVIVPIVIPALDVVPVLPDTVRRAGGFGSTGVK